MSACIDAAEDRSIAPACGESRVPSQALYPPAAEKRRIENLLTEELLDAVARMKPAQRRRISTAKLSKPI